MTKTEQLVKESANTALNWRRANAPEKIDNASLPAGSEMTFYCRKCGHVSDVQPENYTTTPLTLCVDCLDMEKYGWVE